MITLATKFHGPTNTLGARISCRAAGRPWRVYVSRLYGPGDIENHTRALAAFCHKFFPKHADEPERWIAYHHGYTDEGMAFIRLLPGDVAHDTVWINNATGAYSLTDPTAPEDRPEDAEWFQEVTND